MKKRHLTRDELIARCNAVARQRRTADRSSWTAITIVTSYSLLKLFQLEGEELAQLSADAETYQQKILSGEVDMKQIQDELMNYAGWTVEYKAFTEADIAFKKGTFDYWIQQREIDPGNSINEFSTRFLLSLFHILKEKGYSVEKLTEAKDGISDTFNKYSADELSVKQMEKYLEDEVGLIYERPKDPLENGRK